MRMMHVVEAEATLDAEPAAIGRTVAAGDILDLLVLDMEGELAADAAEGTERVDLLNCLRHADIPLVHQGRRQQRAGRAGLHRQEEHKSELQTPMPTSYAD